MLRFHPDHVRVFPAWFWALTVTALDAAVNEDDILLSVLCRNCTSSMHVPDWMKPLGYDSPLMDSDLVSESLVAMQGYLLRVQRGCKSVDLNPHRRELIGLSRENEGISCFWKFDEHAGRSNEGSVSCVCMLLDLDPLKRELVLSEGLRSSCRHGRTFCFWNFGDIYSRSVVLVQVGWLLSMQKRAYSLPRTRILRVLVTMKGDLLTECSVDAGWLTLIHTKES